MRRSLTAASTCLLLALSACGGDSDPQAGPSSAEATTTSSAGTGAAASSSPAPVTSAVATAPGSTGAAVGGTGGAATTSTTAPPRRTTPVTAPSAAGAPSTKQATAAGDYLFDTTGTVTIGAAPQPVDGTSTLTVDPASGDQQHSVLKGDQGQTEQDVLLREAGIYVSRLQITTPAFDKAFEPEPAALLVPSPATVGKTWSWTATSTDGKTTIRQSSEVVRTETLTIGGKRVVCQVVETALKLTGDITYDGQLTTWYAESVKLAVKERNKGKGTAGGFMFATDVTSTARSTTPA